MSSREKLLGIISIILALALLLGAFAFYKSSQKDTYPKEITNTEKPQHSGDGEVLYESVITISVIGKDAKEQKYEIKTHAKYLSEAMEETEGLTFDGTDGPYGIMLEEVNGQRAVYEEDGAYWSILVDGQYGMHGIDSQPVIDGVHYSIVYTLA